MNTRTIVSIAAVVFSLSVFSVTPTSAQPAAGTTTQAGASQHHRMMADMMKDMGQEMNKMSEQMMKGDMGPDQKKQMHKRMEVMSEMMKRMSGLQDRPSMNDAEMKKQMDQMRKQMHEMMRDQAMKPKAK